MLANSVQVSDQDFVQFNRKMILEKYHNDALHQIILCLSNALIQCYLFDIHHVRETYYRFDISLNRIKYTMSTIPPVVNPLSNIPLP